MTRVVLVNPSITRSGQVTIFKRRLFSVKQFKTPPLGLLSIAGCLEKDGHDVSILDAYIDDLTLSDTIKKIFIQKPSVIGVSANAGNYADARDLAKAIKKTDNQTKLVMGGPFPSEVPEFVLKDTNADYVIAGEGELPFSRISDCLAKNASVGISKIDGIASLGKNGKVMLNPQKRTKNLDDLGKRAWHLIDLKKYRPHPASYKKLPAISTITSRGCPFKCIYCSRRIFGGTCRYNSIAYVREELELLKSYGIVDINFWDDTFTLNASRTRELCKQLKETGLIWNCSTRVDCVNEKLLTEMAESGCYEIGYGMESGSQRILDFMKKGVNIGQMKKAITLTKKAGISTKTYFLIGFPGETEEDIRKTIDLAIELDTDIVAYAILTPYPGSELFDMLGVSDVNYDNISYAKLGLTASDRFSAEELRAFLNEARRRFYLRPGYIWRMVRNIKSISDVSRYITAILSLT